MSRWLEIAAIIGEANSSPYHAAAWQRNSVRPMDGCRLAGFMIRCYGMSNGLRTCLNYPFFRLGNLIQAGLDLVTASDVSGPTGPNRWQIRAQPCIQGNVAVQPARVPVTFRHLLGIGSWACLINGECLNLVVPASRVWRSGRLLPRWRQIGSGRAIACCWFVQRWQE